MGERRGVMHCLQFNASTLHTGIAQFRLAKNYSAVALGFDHSLKRARGTPGNKHPRNTRAGFRGDSVKLRRGNRGVKNSWGLSGVVFPGDKSCSVKRALESLLCSMQIQLQC